MSEAHARDGQIAPLRQDAGVRVLLIDENRLLSQALAFFLEADAELEVVGDLSDPEVSLVRARRSRPDVVLLSYPLLHSGGVDLAAALRQELPAVKIIILTASLDEETLSTCVQAGAVGCAPKDMPPAQLVRAIKRVHAGEVLFAPEILVRLLTRPQRGPRPLPRALAPREVEVLQVLATGASTEDAAARLGITTHTVRTHVKNAISKLEAGSKLEAVLIALRAGLISLPE